MRFERELLKGLAPTLVMELLARQAMPDKADEITRMFREGRPDIALLDTLEKSRKM